MKQKLFLYIGSALLFGILISHLQAPILYAYDPNAYIGGAFDTYEKSITEGDAPRSYTFWLFPSPDATSTTGSVTIRTTTPSQCVIGETAGSLGADYTVYFSNVVGNAPFGFTVQPVDDLLADGSTKCDAFIDVNVNGSYYSGYTNKLVYSNWAYDNDNTVVAYMDATAGWSVPEDTKVDDPSYIGTQYSVIMNGTMPELVTLTATSDGQCEFTNDSRTGTVGTLKSYTIGPYTTQQRVVRNFTMVPIDDNYDDDKNDCYITTKITSQDSRWSSITFPKYRMGVIDNDDPDKIAISTNQGTSTSSHSSPPSNESIANTDSLEIEQNDIIDTLVNGKPSRTVSTVYYNDDGSVILSGKAPVNTTIVLYIFSEPRNATVVANADGDWTYIITDLEPGDHRVEAEIISDDQLPTGRGVEIAKFHLGDSPTQTEEKTAPIQSMQYLLPIFGGILIIILIIVFFAFKKTTGLALLYRLRMYLYKLRSK